MGKPTVVTDQTFEQEVLKSDTPVLVDFWATWCAPCIAAFPHLREWHTEFAGKDFAVLGVTSYFQNIPRTEENEKLEQFVDEHSLRYPIMLVSLADFKRAGRDYGFDGIPTLVLIDRKGRLRNSWSGLRPGVAKEVHDELQKLVAER